MQYIVTLLFLYLLHEDVHGITYSGCFTQPAGVSTPTDIVSLAWGNKISLTANKRTIQTCIDHCTKQDGKYAAVETKGTVMSCLCGSERAFKRLGTPYDINSNTPCHHKIWSLRTYVAKDDVSSQYIGCYTEVLDVANMASSMNEWIDKWVMTPKECIRYCKFNGGAYAGLKEGDTCTCGTTYAKHGQSVPASCDTPCVGSLGERCGGNLAISVYSTLGTSDALTPDSSPLIVNFKTYPAVKVPTTQLLLQRMLNVQNAVELKQPMKDGQVLSNHFSKGSRLVQQVLDIQRPLKEMFNSDSFSLSRSTQVSTWLHKNFPPELQKFVDLIKHSQTFIHTHVRQVMNFTDTFSSSALQLQAALSRAKHSLNNYFDYNILSNGLDSTFKLAKLMISSSRTCLPLLGASKDVMVNNVETAASALLGGAHGINKYIENLQKPFSTSAAAGIALPDVDTDSWKDSLKDISSSWSAFMASSGMKLNRLIIGTYQRSCADTAVGKRAVCQVGLLEMLRESGDNQAKVDVQRFIEENTEAFRAFDWSIYEDKMATIHRDLERIEQYLISARLSSQLSVDQLLKSATSFKYYQSCVENLSTMIRSVCHTSVSSKPSLVHPLLC